MKSDKAIKVSLKLHKTKMMCALLALFPVFLFVSQSCKEHRKIEEKVYAPNSFAVVVYVDSTVLPDEFERIRSFVANIAGTYPSSGTSLEVIRSTRGNVIRADCRNASKEERLEAISYLNRMIKSEGLDDRTKVVVITPP